MTPVSWPSLVLTISKLAAGVALCMTGHADIGMILLGAGVYASGANGFARKQENGSGHAGV